MTEKKFIINMSEPMEVRPIALAVQLAGKFDSTIYIQADTKKVNAKSIMGMMSLAMNNGDEATVIADGADEEDACASIADFFTGK